MVLWPLFFVVNGWCESVNTICICVEWEEEEEEEEEEATHMSHRGLDLLRHKTYDLLSCVSHFWIRKKEIKGPQAANEVVTVVMSELLIVVLLIIQKAFELGRASSRERV